MSQRVRFSMPLNRPMETYLQLRNGLLCLQGTNTNHLSWLQAIVDIRASLLGEAGRRPAVPDMLAIFESLGTYLKTLQRQHPGFSNQIEQALSQVHQHTEALHSGLGDALSFLKEDALIQNYFTAMQKQDWLAHKSCLPETISALSHANDKRMAFLVDALRPMVKAIQDLEIMLHDFVGWVERNANKGLDQVQPEKNQSYGLLVVGLSRTLVEQGIVPDMAGNRYSIQLRFQHWPLGKAQTQVQEDVPYSLMLVPMVTR